MTKRNSDEPSAEPVDNTGNGPADPLAFAPWPSSARSEEEREERIRYERIWDAFARGDFRACRREAIALARSAQDEEVRLRAQALSDRLRVDPLAVGVAFGAVLVLLMALFSAYG